MEEKAELRAKISKDLMTILRIIRIKREMEFIPKLLKALREYFENHRRS